MIIELFIGDKDVIYLLLVYFVYVTKSEPVNGERVLYLFALYSVHFPGLHIVLMKSQLFDRARGLFGRVRGSESCLCRAEGGTSQG